MFQDFNSKVEKGDGAINSTQISWHIGFGNRDYDCVFPDDENIVMDD